MGVLHNAGGGGQHRCIGSLFSALLLCCGVDAGRRGTIGHLCSVKHQRHHRIGFLAEAFFESNAYGAGRVRSPRDAWHKS